MYGFTLAAAAQIGHKGIEVFRLHAGRAHGAYFLLVGEYAYGGLMRRGDIHNGAQRGICAAAVVMSVAAYQAAVESDVAGREIRDDGQLGGEEIMLGDAVFFIQQLKYRKLCAVAALFVLGVRNGADKHAQAFARNALGHALGHLL